MYKVHCINNIAKVGTDALGEGFMLTSLNPVLRIVLAAAGLMLIYPGTLTDVIGTAITVAVFIIELQLRKKAQPA